MSTEKTFSIVGVSTLKGEVKVRFANDIARVKVLAKGGHEDIVLIQLDNAMSKQDAVNFIKDLPEFSHVDAQLAISDYLVKTAIADKPKREPKQKPVVAEPIVTATGDVTVVQVTDEVETDEVETEDDVEDENVPF